MTVGGRGFTTGAHLAIISIPASTVCVACTSGCLVKQVSEEIGCLWRIVENRFIPVCRENAVLEAVFLTIHKRLVL